MSTCGVGWGGAANEHVWGGVGQQMSTCGVGWGFM